MKKKLLALATVVLVFAAVAFATDGFEGGKTQTDPASHTPGAQVPALMVDGVLYLISPVPDHYLETAPDPADLVGTVTSQVPLSQMPAQDGESNCWPVGAAIAVCEKGIAVQQGNAWRVLVPAEEGGN